MTAPSPASASLYDELIARLKATAEQHQAVTTHDRPVIVVAGAGSGKTYVLVNRFLALLAANPSWKLDHIVAITFTEKAAGEMRSRVRSALEAQVAGASSEAARARWAELLASMDSARITTIHGICSTILAANAAAARIDPAFRVLDEVESALLRTDAIDDVLRAAASPEAGTAEAGTAKAGTASASAFAVHVRALIAEYGTQTVRTMLRTMLVSRAVVLPTETGDSLLAVWTRLWLREVARAACAASARIGTVERVPSPARGDKFWEKWEKVCAYVADLHACAERLTAAHDADAAEAVNADADMLECAAQAAALLEAVRALPHHAPSVKAWGEATAADMGARFKAVRDAAKAAHDHIGAVCGMQPPTGPHDHAAARFLTGWAVLATAVRARYTALKSERAALDFDDLEHLTAQVLADPDAAARYIGGPDGGGAFRQIMVDEFQDTNTTQWGIVQALAHPAMGARLFCVGDPKQSIYKFRGADVAVFEAARAAIGRHGAEIVMAQSFRTHAPLVGAFNHVFAGLMQREADDALYETAFGQPMTAARAEPPSREPALEVLLVDGNYAEDRAHTTDEGGTALARRWEADVLARRLRALVESGRLVHVREHGKTRTRPVAWGDIAMLFRVMGNTALYEDALRRHGIPFYTIAGQGYYDRQEVWDILNMLRALNTPADSLALAAALHSPLFNLSDEALFALRLAADAVPTPDGARRPLADALAWAADAPEQLAPWLPAAEADAVRAAAVTVRDLRALAGRLGVSEIIRLLTEKTGYIAVMAGTPGGVGRRLNVEKLIEIARSGAHLRLSDFIAHMDDLTTRTEVREGDASSEVVNSVTLMTVHRSKGLEYPVVCLADASYHRNPDGAVLRYTHGIGMGCSTWDEDAGRQQPGFMARMLAHGETARETAESKRLLYVAATRAQDMLIVSGTFTRDENVIKMAGWLGWLFPETALGITLPDGYPPRGKGKVNIPAGHTTYTLDNACGAVQVCFAGADSLAQALAPDPAGAVPDRAWAAAQASPAPPPANMPPVVSRSTTRARSLSVTQLGHLGAFRAAGPGERAAYRHRWRTDVLHAAPDRVAGVLRPLRQPTARQIGEIVHKALRWHAGAPDQGAHTPARDPKAMLSYFIWEEGITDPNAQTVAYSRAAHLLDSVLHDPLQRRVEQAARDGRPVYRELPFVFRTETTDVHGAVQPLRTIHGVIDLLFLAEDGRWTIVDYKTGILPKGITPEADAQRHHVQVGVYAAAVLEMLGIAQEQADAALDVNIQYIRPKPDSAPVLVAVKAAQWAAALERLEPLIGELLEQEGEEAGPA